MILVLTPKWTIKPCVLPWPCFLQTRNFLISKHFPTSYFLSRPLTFSLEITELRDTDRRDTEAISLFPWLLILGH